MATYNAISYQPFPIPMGTGVRVGFYSQPAREALGVGVNTMVALSTYTPPQGQFWPTSGNAGSGRASDVRALTTKTTPTLAAGAQEVGVVPLALGYRIYRVNCSAPSWVRLYTTLEKRDGDIGRFIGTDPVGDHGVVLEYIATPVLLVADLSPAVDGFDGNPSPDGQIPIIITNTAASSAAISVIFTWIRTE